MCLPQHDTRTFLWGTLSRPSNPSLSQWHHKIMTSGSTADHRALKGERVRWCSAAVRAAKNAKSTPLVSTFLRSQRTLFLLLFILQLSTVFFHVCFQHKLPISYFWERAGGGKQGTSTHSFTYRRGGVCFWHINHLQEMGGEFSLNHRSKGNLTRPTGFTQAIHFLFFFFCFFCFCQPKERHMRSSMLNSREQTWANLATWKHVGWAMCCICYTACTLFFFCGATGCDHSSRRCKADLGCGTNLYM